MGILETTGFILALAVLAGFNLYFTVFLTGIAVRLDWFHWASQAEFLQPFAHPLVIVVALLLFLVEFGIDKIPWADSLWDSIHTFLRPAGAILLAVTALGPEAATFKQVFVGMGAGAAALLAHLAKAGIRLNINTSPEPFSNIIASVVEDIAVGAGFMLAVNNPLAALPIFGVLLLVIAWFSPLIVRSGRAILWLIWKKLRVPAGSRSTSGSLPDKLSADEQVLVTQNISGDAGRIVWAVPCVTGKVKNNKGLPRHVFGHLVALDQKTAPLIFTGKRRFTKFAVPVSLAGCKVTHEEHFLSESLVIFSRKTKSHLAFRFHRGQSEIAEHLVADLEKRIKAIKKLDPESADEEEIESAEELITKAAPEPIAEEKPTKPSAFPDAPVDAEPEKETLPDSEEIEESEETPRNDAN